MEATLNHRHFGSLNTLGDTWISYGTHYGVFYDATGQHVNLPLNEVTIDFVTDTKQDPHASFKAKYGVNPFTFGAEIVSNRRCYDCGQRFATPPSDRDDTADPSHFTREWWDLNEPQHKHCFE